MIEEFAGYDYPGPSDAAVAYYEKALAKRGFQRAADRDAQGRRELSFQKDGTSVTVSLRNVGKEQKIVSILVTVMRPRQ